MIMNVVHIVTNALLTAKPVQDNNNYVYRLPKRPATSCFTDMNFVWFQEQTSTVL